MKIGNTGEREAMSDREEYDEIEIKSDGIEEIWKSCQFCETGATTILTGGLETENGKERGHYYLKCDDCGLLVEMIHDPKNDIYVFKSLGIPSSFN